MAQVKVIQPKRRDYQSEDEFREAQMMNLESALKKFKRKVNNEGIIKNYRERMYFKSNTEKRKEAQAAARAKQMRKIRLEEKFNKD